MQRRLGTIVAAGALAMFAAGCGPQTELGGTPVPNQLPDTRITATPPDPSETTCTVGFQWIGSDPDGFVTAFEWRLSDNGDDGISVQDTLTSDPVTGAILHPWHTTASAETTFVVSADQDSFPGDPPGLARSYQTHTFFLRAIDDDGGVDPTPASITFTSTTLVPSASIEAPSVTHSEPTTMAPQISFLYGGDDPDFVTRRPTKIRFLFKQAVLEDGTMADTRNKVVANLEHFASFSDSAWSAWQPFAPSEDARRVSFEGQPAEDTQGNRIYYIFCSQTEDTTGAVSVDRTYGNNLRHFWITARSPVLTVTEPHLGKVSAVGLSNVRGFDIAAGQVVIFSWIGSADGYVGEIASYRYGWDLADPNDPQDSHWAVAPGISPQHLRAAPAVFTGGVHLLTVEVRDTLGQVSRVQVRLHVVPVPDYADRLSVLWVDDVPDRLSNSWPSVLGQGLDNDAYRDRFWLNALDGPAGVAGFLVDRDVVDAEVDDPTYRQIVQYRTVLWTARWAASPQGFITRNFRTPNFTDDRYNWLIPFQANVGNLFYCGQRGMDAFLKTTTSYAMPIVFTSIAGDQNGYEGNLRVSFGQRQAADGSWYYIGPTRYPYVAWGISALDQTSPSSAYKIFGSNPLVAVSAGRRSSCAAMKAVTIDPTYMMRHMPGGITFADTIGTNADIDWRDLLIQYRDSLSLTYAWGNTEFYDQDISPGAAFFRPQECEAGPDGLCVEPMLRCLARFDWIRRRHQLEDPSDPWPEGYYTQPLTTLCGKYALRPGETSALTTGSVVGFVSHKSTLNKPSLRGDVAWGFDPYRFEATSMTALVQWVLGHHFDLPMRQ